MHSISIITYIKLIAKRIYLQAWIDDLYRIGYRFPKINEFIDENEFGNCRNAYLAIDYENDNQYKVYRFW